jgi:hypothetical protein
MRGWSKDLGSLPYGCPGDRGAGLPKTVSLIPATKPLISTLIALRRGRILPVFHFTAIGTSIAL